MKNRIELLQVDFAETLKRAGGEADLILMSPPYVDARTYGADVVFGAEELERLGYGCFAALRPGGQVLMVLDAPVREWRKDIGTERGFHPWETMLDWAKRVGFRVPDRMAYVRAGSPGEFTGRFRNDWEPLLWFVKPGGPVTHNPREIAAEAKHGMVLKPPATYNRDGTVRRYEKKSAGWASLEGKRLRGTLWDYGHVGGNKDTKAAIETKHPARFPLALARDIVLCFSKPGDLVVDPFLGSGTSLVATILYAEGRRFLGGDLLSNDEGVPWIEVAKKRIKQEREHQKTAVAVTGWHRRHSLDELRFLLSKLYATPEEAQDRLWKDLRQKGEWKVEKKGPKGERLKDAP